MRCANHFKQKNLADHGVNFPVNTLSYKTVCYTLIDEEVCLKDVVNCQ